METDKEAIWYGIQQRGVDDGKKKGKEGEWKYGKGFQNSFQNRKNGSEFKLLVSQR